MAALALVAPVSRTSADLARAVVRTVAYADLFDFPLETGEVQRYLIGMRATEADVVSAACADTRLARTDGYFHLRGRDEIVALRRRRAAAALRLWRLARSWGALIARLPLVRGVAVTGALAMHNADKDTDIDLFVLAHPRRVWTCRLLVIGVVRAAALRGIRLCPNFVLSTDHLALARRDLFTAHEVVQAVWLGRTPWSDAFMEANAWTRDALPNAAAPIVPSRPESALAAVATATLASPAFDRLERWEMRRKIRRLEERARREGGSVHFSEQECRGHFASHDERVSDAFARRCAELGVAVT